METFLKVIIVTFLIIFSLAFAALFFGGAVYLILVVSGLTTLSWWSCVAIGFGLSLLGGLFGRGSRA